MMKRVWIALALLLLPVLATAQSVTIAPNPFLTVFDNNGLIVNAGCVWTYQAGTTTPATTYSDNILTTNTNPIIADSAGRFTAFLTVGQSYKFVYENVPCSSISHGSVLRTADNINAMPTSAATVDLTSAVAGVNLTAGEAVYLSDGSGAKAAGQWFPADSTNTYSSTTPVIGITMAAISAAASGDVRIAGEVTGLSGLVAGSLYYVSTTGTITTTAPANSRLIGQADTTTSLVVGANPAPPVVPTYWKLLKANSGTDTSAGATTVDTYALASALTVKDSLVVIYTIEAVTQAVTLPIVLNTTDTVTIMSLELAGNMVAGDIVNGTITITDAQSATTNIVAAGLTAPTTNTTEGGGNARAKRTTFTTPWTGAWTIGLRHGGVTGGGTFTWRWAIYRVVGQ
jgi:hypothetical protein